MDSISVFLQNFDIENLVNYLVRAGAALICIVLHELSHGLAAYAMGDKTAKENGRLSLNPLRHIDLLGLVLMITVGFGWAKPVPVHMNRFKHPKRAMALTALAGPASNLVTAFVALLGASGVYQLFLATNGAGVETLSWVFTFMAYVAMLSVGLGVFNLIPIPPLDGSKVLFALLPEKSYRTILYYERYVMLLLFALVFMGMLDTPLYTVRTAILTVMCRVAGLPEGVLW